MVKKILSLLKYIVFLGGGLVLVWWQLHSMTDEQETQFINAFKSANYILVIPVVIINLLSHLSRSKRWKLLMEPLGYNPSLKNVFAATMVGYLANSAVPRLGEVLKCTILAKYEKLPADKLIGTILIERTFDLITYFFFIAFTVIIQIDVVGNFVKNKLENATNGTYPWWLKLMLFVVFILIIIFVVKKIFSCFPSNKTVIAVKHFFEGIGKGFVAIKNLKDRKAFILHTIFIWCMYLLQIYLGFKAMEGTAHLTIKAACSVLSLSTLAMIITPGGIGSFPFFVMETLAIYGIANSQGNAFGWLIWGVSTGIIIIAGLISLLILPYINKTKNEVNLSDSE
jgi:glycosyltransferase 2 family protein